MLAMRATHCDRMGGKAQLVSVMGTCRVKGKECRFSQGQADGQRSAKEAAIWKGSKELR